MHSLELRESTILLFLGWRWEPGGKGRAHSIDSRKPEEETHGPELHRLRHWVYSLGCRLVHPVRSKGEFSEGSLALLSSPGWQVTSTLSSGHEGPACFPLAPGHSALPVLSAHPRFQEMSDFHGHAPCRREFPRHQKSHCEYGLWAKEWVGKGGYLLTWRASAFLFFCLRKTWNTHHLYLFLCLPPQQAKDTFQNVTILSTSETLHQIKVLLCFCSFLYCYFSQWSGPGLRKKSSPCPLLFPNLQSTLNASGFSPINSCVRAHLCLRDSENPGSHHSVVCIYEDFICCFFFYVPIDIDSRIVVTRGEREGERAKRIKGVKYIVAEQD